MATRCIISLTGGAVAALKSVVIDKCRLQGVKFRACAQAFDRRALIAVMQSSQRQTQIDSLAVHHHGAGSTLTVIAALLRARQVQSIAQRIEQRNTRLDRQLLHHAIDSQADIDRWQRVIRLNPLLSSCAMRPEMLMAIKYCSSRSAECFAALRHLIADLRWRCDLGLSVGRGTGRS